MLRNYAEIHLLRQQHPSAVSTPASLLSYKSAQHATRCAYVRTACRQVGSVIVVARATEKRVGLLERETPSDSTDATPAMEAHTIQCYFFYFAAIFRATSQQPSKQCLEHCCEVVLGSYRMFASYVAVSAPREGRTGTRSAWRRGWNAPVHPSPPRYQRTQPTGSLQIGPPHLPGVEPGPRQQQHPSRGASPAAPSSPSWPQYAAARRCEWSQSIDCGTQSIDWRESSR